MLVLPFLKTVIFKKTNKKTCISKKSLIALCTWSENKLCGTYYLCIRHMSVYLIGLYQYSEFQFFILDFDTYPIICDFSINYCMSAFSSWEHFWNYDILSNSTNVLNTGNRKMIIKDNWCQKTIILHRIWYGNMRQMLDCKTEKTGQLSQFE